jgi:hypothetical protein
MSATGNPLNVLINNDHIRGRFHKHFCPSFWLEQAFLGNWQTDLANKFGKWREKKHLKVKKVKKFQRNYLEVKNFSLVKSTLGPILNL